jgi:two-component system LytT family response regulator
MSKVIIIDDEPLARAIVKEYLKGFPELTLVAECSDGFEGVKKIAEHQPDLIFLDIQMPKINGFEMLELISESPAVIFTTAFDEFALKAFEASALDYLLKPFTKERFTAAIDKWKISSSLNSIRPSEQLSQLNNLEKKQPDEHLRVVIKDGSDIKIIPTADIHYFEAYDDYVKIYLNEKYHLKKKTMNYFEKVLPTNQFTRVHRSFIININELTKIESFEKNAYVAILKSGKRIPISRTAYGPLKESLGV